MEYKQIMDDLSKKIYYPIYLLSGEEPYYIDQIADYIADTVLTPDEQSFNQTIVYGKDSDVHTISQLARKFPMMSNYQVIIVKEAQDLKNIEEFEHYASNPMKSTILVICYKYKKYPKTTTFAKHVKKYGVIFDSEPLRDYQVSTWIQQYVKEKKYSINQDTSELLAQYLGTSLHKIVNELQKLMIILPIGSTIGKSDIERNIGISKDYNTFELQDAFGSRDNYKVQQIMKVFAANPKENPPSKIIPLLFTYFKNLLLIHFIPVKTNEAIVQHVKISNSSFIIKKYIDASKRYSPQKLVQIISLLREFDLKSKGVNSGNISEGDLLRELAFKILH
jgi:DNA polymerase-3 subunit delta